MHLCKNTTDMTCVSYLEYVMWLCLVTDDTDHDHLVKVVSPGFLHCEVTVFPDTVFSVFKILNSLQGGLCLYVHFKEEERRAAFLSFVFK